MADNSRISLSSDLGETLSRFAGQLGDVPTRVEMAQTRGEATMPLYGYHESLNRLGQHAADQAGEFLATVHSMQSWMVETIADLERVDQEAAEVLRKLQADIEGYGQEWRAPAPSSAPAAAKTPASPADGAGAAGAQSDWA